MLLGLMCLLPLWLCAQPDAAFSVGENTRVIFAGGNLKYSPLQDAWRFMGHQYDISEGSDWCRFGWATSGYNGMDGNLDTPHNTDYGPAEGNLDSTRYDWGLNNVIKNGDIYSWRTLNASEWEYLLNVRPGAARLRGKAIVNGIPGIVLLPDNWVQPSNVTFSCGENYSVNRYSLVLWAHMEQAGAVFLPAAGYGWDGESVEWREAGYYWTTTTYDDQSAVLLRFDATSTQIQPAPRRYGAAVRLVSNCR